MGERPSFRRARGSGFGTAKVLALTAVVAAGLLAMRTRLPAEPVAPEPVQVVGDVPAPGWYLLEQPTLHRALQASGLDPAAWPERPLPAGWRVVVTGDEVHLEPADEDLVFGLPMDLNRADVPALQALPGVGPTLAAAIVAHREAHGPFVVVADLVAVRGIGPARLEALRPFVTVGE